jgi:uncharacterized protein YjdB
MFRKMLALLLAALFILTAIPAYAAPGEGNNDGNYYKAVSQLVSSRWDDSYFSKATLSIGVDVLEVDNRSIKMNNKAEIKEGELTLPAEVFEALGVQVESGSQGVSLTKKGTNIEIKFAEKSMKVNGNKKGMPAAAALKNGKPVLPVSVLNELGMGFKIIFDEKAGEITITNEYQMARVFAKTKPGKAAPMNIEAAQIIVGPHGQNVYQFDTEEAAIAAYEILNASPSIEYAEPDMLIMLEGEAAYAWEEFYPEEQYLAASYTHLGWGPERIGSDKYLDYLISGGKQNAAVTVAVVDTGLDMTHPFFAGRYLPGYNFVSGNENPVDDHSHGTHVSGTVLDVAIALPNVKILPVKVLNNQGQGSTINVANGVCWAAENGAQVINMSLGGSHSQVLDDAVKYAFNRNITVVVAAGNDNDDAKNYCPAHIEEAITVSAFDKADKPANFTNYGACVDVAAPGVDIVSTVLGGGAGSKQGTSMAAPHVAGAAALLLCDNPSITPNAIKTLIRFSADPLATNSRYYGSGILNIGELAGNIASQSLLATPGNINFIINSGLKQVQLNIEYFDNGKVTNVTNLADYSSSNTNVAAVTSSGLVTLVGAGLANITVSYNGKSIIVPVAAESMAPLAVVSSSPENGAAEVGIFAFIHLAFNYDLTSFVTYSLVSQSGKSIANASQTRAGSGVNITFAESLEPGMEYTFTIPAGGVTSYYGTLAKPFVLKFKTSTRPPPASISVSPSEATLTVRSTYQLTATVFPIETYYGTCSWYSSNSSVATVNSVGIVTAVTAGTATITARTVNGFTASCAITVVLPPQPASVTISPNEVTTAVYEASCRLNVTVEPDGSTYWPITWTSDNPEIAAVSGTGSVAFVTGRAAGTAIITASTVNGLTVACKVTVNPQPLPESIFVWPQEVTLPADTTHQLGVMILPAASRYGLELTFASDNTQVASVSDQGLITAKSAGTANITVTTVNGISDICAVTVFAPQPPDSVTVLPREVTLVVGSTRQLTATVSPSGANNVLSWTSGNAAVATVSSVGLVTAIAAGKATITATTVNGLTATCVVTVPDLTPPVITLKGSASITVNLGNAFVEPGYTAIDDVDGDITDRVVISGSINTGVAGVYILTYTVYDDAGNVARATRTVNVVVPSANFSFNNQGKAGSSFNNNFTAAFGGKAVFTVSGLNNNKSSVTISVNNSAGLEVLKNTFTANGSKEVILGADNYAVSTKIDSGNGNISVGLSIVITGDGLPAPRTAPQIELIGSRQIILHLGGSAYVEQGVKATDTLDGEIGPNAVIESNVDTSCAGNYTVKYTVTNTAGLSASVTRNISVIAPETRAVPGKSFNFSPKGKQGESFTYNFDAGVDGNIALTISGLNKTTTTVTVNDSTGMEAFKETLTENATRNFQASAGRLSVKVTIDSASGNSSFSLNFATAGGTEIYFPLPEITR